MITTAPTWCLRSVSDGRRPWWGQRLARRLARDLAPGGQLLGIAGRQVGKTEVGVEILLSCGLSQPGGESCILVPTYRLGLVQARRLRELGERVGGVWHAQHGYLELPNGHLIWLRSADKPDATRGLTITGWLWLDEAALISEAAFKAAMGCLLTGNGRILITTTPRGRSSWVYRIWADREAPDTSRFKLRASDAPFISQAQLDRNRRGMGGGFALQELDAEFTDDAATPFPPELVDMLLRDAINLRGKRLALGLDLAKEHDYVVATLCNEWGEAWILGRWRHVAWPDTWDRIEGMARTHRATIFMDEAGGAGGTTKDELVRRLGEERVVGVRTNVGKVKQQLVEELQADTQHGRLRVDNRCPSAKDLRHELLFLVPRRVITKGTEHINYGPSSEDDHDDTVTSLSLANHGRRVMEGLTSGDVSEFFRQTPGGIAPQRAGVGRPATLAPGHNRGGWGQRIDQGRRM